ncbi:PREDICTED: uncharacterized protein LOC101314727 [Fragaria vesca subsp. vesca]
MDALYSKLYHRFSQFKTEKFSELDEKNKVQEDKFLNFIQVAEEYRQHVESENERLHSQLNELRSELASLRSAKDEQFNEYQKLLMEENKKNKELSEELRKLQKMRQAETFSRMKDSNTDNDELCMSGGDEVSGEVGNSTRRRDTNKRKRRSGSETGDMDMPSRIHEDSVLRSESAKDLHKETMHREYLVISRKTNVNFQSQCCRNLEESGGSVTGTSNCLFQELTEHLWGLKFSILDQTEETCIKAVHQSSGYSFTLTWVNRATGNQEILYRFLSLGTFERVAPEWMDDELLFSKTMLPIFFERGMNYFLGRGGTVVCCLDPQIWNFNVVLSPVGDVLKSCTHSWAALRS